MASAWPALHSAPRPQSKSPKSCLCPLRYCLWLLRDVGISRTGTPQSVLRQPQGKPPLILSPCLENSYSVFKTHLLQEVCLELPCVSFLPRNSMVPLGLPIPGPPSSLHFWSPDTTSLCSTEVSQGGWAQPTSPQCAPHQALADSESGTSAARGTAGQGSDRDVGRHEAPGAPAPALGPGRAGEGWGPGDITAPSPAQTPTPRLPSGPWLGSGRRASPRRRQRAGLRPPAPQSPSAAWGWGTGATVLTGHLWAPALLRVPGREVSPQTVSWSHPPPCNRGN